MRQKLGDNKKISKSKERLLDKNHWNHPNFALPNVPVFLFYVGSFNKIIYVEGNSQSVFPRFLAPRKGVNRFLNLNFFVHVYHCIFVWRGYKSTLVPLILSVPCISSPTDVFFKTAILRLHSKVTRKNSCT